VLSGESSGISGVFSASESRNFAEVERGYLAAEAITVFVVPIPVTDVQNVQILPKKFSLTRA
jgi:hypothetical protein